MSSLAQLRVSVCACMLAGIVCPHSLAQTQPQTPAQPAVTLPSPKEPSPKQRAQASDAYLNGARMLDRQDFPAAEKAFGRAVELDPGNRDYIRALAIAREHHVTNLVQHAGRLRLEGHPEQAEPLLQQALKLDPDNAIVTQHTTPATRLSPAWLEKPPVYAGAIHLAPSTATKSFHQRADLQELIRQVSQSYGIRVAFDGTIPHQSIRFDIDDVSYARVMPILYSMGHLFAVPLDATSVLLARDTTENRQRLERQMQETIYIPEVTGEQMTEFGNVVRNIFDVKQTTLENNLGSIIVRAPQETLTALNRTLEDLLGGSNEVLLELKLYSIDTTHGRNTGLSLPQQIGAYNLASQANSLVSQNQDLVNQAIAQGLIPATASTLQIALYLLASGLVTSPLLAETVGLFGGGWTTSGVYTTSGATLNLGLSSSDTRGLDEIQLRVSDRQAAQFRIGNRYPITTSTYSSGVTSNSSSLAGVNINGVPASSLLSQYLGTGSGVTIPQIQYEDLGLTLKATPTVMQEGGINLKLDLKIESLAGGSLDNIPILTSRQITSDVTVQDGETTMILSNANRSEARAINGTPGLSELPGFQSASDQTVEADTSQLVLLLTPHVVRHRPNQFAGPLIPLSLPQSGEN